MFSCDFGHWVDLSTGRNCSFRGAEVTSQTPWPATKALKQAWCAGGRALSEVKMSRDGNFHGEKNTVFFF